MTNQYSFQDRAAIEAFNYYLHCEEEPLNASFSLCLYKALKAAATDDCTSAVIWSDLRERFDFAGLAPRNTKETQLYRLYPLIAARVNGAAEARVKGAAEPAFSTLYTAEAARAHAGAFRALKEARAAAPAQPQADTRDAERCGSEPVTGTPFLQEEDQYLLDRFIETTEDNEGFDIGKEAIKRLANLGVVESLGFGRYAVSTFGYWVQEHYWHQNPSLPLKTNSDRDADARAAIAAAKENK